MSESVNISLIVIYHSRHGHTGRVAEAVVRGAASVEGTSTHLLTVDEAQDRWDLLNTADAIIIGAPTYMGSLSAPMKAFMDASLPVYVSKMWNGKIAGGFTNAGSTAGDKQNSLIQLMTFASQHEMIWVGLGLGAGNNRSRTTNDILNRDSYTIGLATQSDVDLLDEGPIGSDLRTAEFYGRRIADFAQIAVAGRQMLARPTLHVQPGGAEVRDPERRGIMADS